MRTLFLLVVTIIGAVLLLMYWFSLTGR